MDSPFEQLRQLKAMLDDGTLTPAEFEALKRKLVFGDAPPAGATVPPVVPAAPEPVVAELLYGPPPAGASTAVAVEAEETDFDQTSEAPAPRNYLNLVLALGGLLAVLALVLYLNLNQHPSEHIGSTSITEADSAQAIEVGPTVPQPVARPAVPETVRVRPQLPVVAPPTVAEPTLAAPTDSVAEPVSPPDLEK